MMHRNLDRRVEACAQVNDPVSRDRICTILDLSLAEDIARWELRADGSWNALTSVSTGRKMRDLQDVLIHERLTASPAHPL
jgi:polyphosphate kinase